MGHFLNWKFIGTSNVLYFLSKKLIGTLNGRGRNLRSGTFRVPMNYKCWNVRLHGRFGTCCCWTNFLLLLEARTMNSMNEESTYSKLLKDLFDFDSYQRPSLMKRVIQKFRVLEVNAWVGCQPGISQSVIIEAIAIVTRDRNPWGTGFASCSD